MSDKTFAKLLSDLKVSDIESPKSIVTVDGGETFEAAFSKLVENNLLSAPVWCEAEKNYVGYLELRDLLSIVLATVDVESGTPKSVDDLLKAAKEHLLATDGVTLTYLARRNPFKVVSPDASLLDVVNLLAAKSATRVRRVAVVDADKKLVGIVSASRCVAFLAEHLEQLGDSANKTVVELELGSTPVQTVQSDTPAVTVYQLLDKLHISGVAITSSSGALFGNISARDLKNFISCAAFDKLSKPIDNFLAELRSEDINIRVPTIQVFEHATLAQIAAKLKATGVHRLYVVDNEASLKPVRVVSVTDVVRCMASLAASS